LKLITSAVAIEKLKPDFRYRTEFYIDGDITLTAFCMEILSLAAR
jgi:hypothetical protein